MLSEHQIVQKCYDLKTLPTNDQLQNYPLLHVFIQHKISEHRSPLYSKRSVSHRIGGNIFESIRNRGLREWLEQNVEYYIDLFKDNVNSFIKFFQKQGKSFFFFFKFDKLEQIFDAIKNASTVAFETIRETLINIQSFFTDLLEQFPQIKTVANFVMNVVSNVMTVISTFLSASITLVKRTASKFFQIVTEFIKPFFVFWTALRAGATSALVSELYTPLERILGRSLLDLDPTKPKSRETFETLEMPDSGLYEFAVKRNATIVLLGYSKRGDNYERANWHISPDDKLFKELDYVCKRFCVFNRIYRFYMGFVGTGAYKEKIDAQIITAFYSLILDLKSLFVHQISKIPIFEVDNTFLKFIFSTGKIFDTMNDEDYKTASKAVVYEKMFDYLLSCLAPSLYESNNSLLKLSIMSSILVQFTPLFQKVLFLYTFKDPEVPHITEELLNMPPLPYFDILDLSVESMSLELAGIIGNTQKIPTSVFGSKEKRSEYVKKLHSTLGSIGMVNEMKKFEFSKYPAIADLILKNLSESLELLDALKTPSFIQRQHTWKYFDGCMESIVDKILTNPNSLMNTVFKNYKSAYIEFMEYPFRKDESVCLFWQGYNTLISTAQSNLSMSEETTLVESRIGAREIESRFGEIQRVMEKFKSKLSLSKSYIEKFATIIREAEPRSEASSSSPIEEEKEEKLTEEDVKDPTLIYTLVDRAKRETPRSKKLTRHQLEALDNLQNRISAYFDVRTDDHLIIRLTEFALSQYISIYDMSFSIEGKDVENVLGTIQECKSERLNNISKAISSQIDNLIHESDISKITPDKRAENLFEKLLVLCTKIKTLLMDEIDNHFTILSIFDPAKENTATNLETVNIKRALINDKMHRYDSFNYLWDNVYRYTTGKEKFNTMDWGSMLIDDKREGIEDTNLFYQELFFYGLNLANSSLNLCIALLAQTCFGKIKSQLNNAFVSIQQSKNFPNIRKKILNPSERMKDDWTNYRTLKMLEEFKIIDHYRDILNTDTLDIGLITYRWYLELRNIELAAFENMLQEFNWTTWKWSFSSSVLGGVTFGTVLYGVSAFTIIPLLPTATALLSASAVVMCTAWMIKSMYGDKLPNAPRVTSLTTEPAEQSKSIGKRIGLGIEDIASGASSIGSYFSDLFSDLLSPTEPVFEPFSESELSEISKLSASYFDSVLAETTRSLPMEIPPTTPVDFTNATRVVQNITEMFTGVVETGCTEIATIHPPLNFTPSLVELGTPLTSLSPLDYPLGTCPAEPESVITTVVNQGVKQLSDLVGDVFERSLKTSSSNVTSSSDIPINASTIVNQEHEESQRFAFIGSLIFTAGEWLSEFWISLYSHIYDLFNWTVRMQTSISNFITIQVISSLIFSVGTFLFTQLSVVFIRDRIRTHIFKGTGLYIVKSTESYPPIYTDATYSINIADENNVSRVKYLQESVTKRQLNILRKSKLSEGFGLAHTTAVLFNLLYNAFALIKVLLSLFAYTIDKTAAVANYIRSWVPSWPVKDLEAITFGSWIGLPAWLSIFPIALYYIQWFGLFVVVLAISFAILWMLRNGGFRFISATFRTVSYYAEAVGAYFWPKLKRAWNNPDDPDDPQNGFKAILSDALTTAFPNFYKTDQFLDKIGIRNLSTQLKRNLAVYHHDVLDETGSGGNVKSYNCTTTPLSTMVNYITNKHVARTYFTIPPDRQINDRSLSLSQKYLLEFAQVTSDDANFWKNLPAGQVIN